MILIAPTEDSATCFALRHEVFVTEQGYSAEGEIDNLDAHARHLVAHDGEIPVGTARISLDGDTAKIGRVCVIKSMRGRGLGADLIEAAVLQAGKMGAVRAVLGAQAQAVPFYRKLGFTPFGAPFEDEGQPHQMMMRPL